MKIYVYVALMLMVGGMVSCGTDKPRNMEADILSVSLYAGDSLIAYGADYYNDSVIDFYVSKRSSYENIRVMFTLSDGASVEPPSGKLYNLSESVPFVVTSEDGENKRHYSLSLHEKLGMDAWHFDFENWNKAIENDVVYYEPVGWSSANKGVAMLLGLIGNKFPTTRTNDSYSGDYAVCIETLKGLCGSSMVPPLISGTAFVGKFNTTYLMVDNLRCAEFGLPFDYDGVHRPKYLQAAVKYTPGQVFYDENCNIASDRADGFSLTAILFTGDEPFTNRDMMHSDRIIAKATAYPYGPHPEYGIVKVAFDYATYGNREIPENELLQIAIIAGSSIEGDFFRGAPGSRLTIDDVEILFE